MMNDCYTIDTTEDVSIIRFLKPPNIDNVRAAIDDFAANPTKFRVWTSDLGHHLKPSQILEIAFHVEKKSLPPGKTAFVTQNEVALDLGKMFNDYYKRKNIETGLFRTVDEAIDWMKGDS